MNQLSNLHILITRPEPHGTELCLRIEEQGGRATNFPTIAFAPTPDPGAFDQAIKKIGTQEWLIFISPQAVYASIVALRTAWPELPPQVKFAAVGAGTAKALQQAGYNVDIIPDDWNSDGLLALPEFQQVQNKKIAVIRGEGGREKIDHILMERGASVLLVIAYQRVLPAVNNSNCLSLLKNSAIDVIVCTSFEGVRNLKILLGDAAWPYIQNLPIIVMSERVKSLAQGLGFQTIWVTPNASNDAVIALLATMRK